METAIPPDADETMDLLTEGFEQATRIHEQLAGVAIYACLRSPPLRAGRTAEIALRGQALPGGTIIVPELRERSRGELSYAPRGWPFDQQPESGVDPERSKQKKPILDWQPEGVDYNGNPGESIRQVADTRVTKVLDLARDIAREVTPEGDIALSGHAEWMVALRALVLGFGNTRMRQPLIPGMLLGNHAFASAKQVVNGQSDWYKCTCGGVEVANMSSGHADMFRSAVYGADTGWHSIQKMRE